MSSIFALANPLGCDYLRGMEQQIQEPRDYLAGIMARLERSKLSGAEICRRANIAESTLRRIKSGELSPTTRTLGKLLGVLERHEAAQQREQA